MNSANPVIGTRTWRVAKLPSLASICASPSDSTAPSGNDAASLA